MAHSFFSNIIFSIKRMAGDKPQRLVKVAKEFNVGISTIVEFLQKKGYTLSGKPNEKISPQHYALLSKEFNKEKDLKKEYETRRRNKRTEKKATISIEDITQNDEEITNVEEVVTITDLSSQTPVVKEPKKEEVQKKSEVKIEKPPVVKSEAPVVKEEVKKEPKVEKPVVKKEEVKEEVKTKKLPEKKEVIAVKTEKPVKKEEKPVVKTEKLLSKTEKTVETKKVEPPTPPTKTTVNKPKIEKKEKQVVSPQKTTTKKEKELKVLGKIDLDTLNQQTRPVKKTRKERQEERREKARREKERIRLLQEKEKQKEILKKEESAKKTAPTEKTEKTQEEVIFKTDVKKLSGPTVIGKIELPEKTKNNKKKLVASSNERKRRRKKRRRVAKDPVSTDQQKTTQQKTTSQQKNQNQNSNQNRNRNQNSNQNRKRRVKKVVRQEPNAQDVSKQIKETLAKLEARGKSKASKHRRQKRSEIRDRIKKEVQLQEEGKNTLKLTEFVSVSEFAKMMNKSVNEVIMSCMNLGYMVSINQRLDADVLTIVAGEFGFDVDFISVEVQESIKEEEDKESDLVTRPPIITIMGHVDHGKTSLLDYIRNTNVIAGESGGITQHVGAYNVTMPSGKKITFLDTPGHHAFTAMRARGAKVTDVVIVVVAADDHVMPQTLEAINHAQAADVPIVFAINKIDRPEANPERVKQELAEKNFLIEEWGGKYQSVDISAKKGTNVNDLLELAILESEMLNLRANPNKNASGSIIESALDRGRGYVAKMLVQNGTLRVGDLMVADRFYGRVKAMFNERNQKIESVGPAEPALVLGLNGAPQAGATFNVLDTEAEIKDIANKREQLQRELSLRTQEHISLEEIGRRIKVGNFRELNLIVKADVDGSVEVLVDSFVKQSNEEVQIKIIHRGVGQITESDVTLADASDAIIIGFQVRPSLNARKLAEKSNVDIRLYSIIYDAVNELRDAIEGMLSPEIKEVILGTLEVKDVFKIPKIGKIAGCLVQEGKILRKSQVRLIRDGIIIYTSELESLKRHSDDAKEVFKGFECGVKIHKYEDVKVGDFIEVFERTEIKRTLK